MAQEFTQIQTQQQQQVQRLSQQQMLQVKLLEMPLTELEQNIAAELDDNPALEELREEGAETEDNTLDAEHEEEDFEAQTEREEREDALDSALEGLGRDDEMPEYRGGTGGQDSADYEEIVYGDTTSFYDKMNEQVAEHDLTEQQKQIMEYLIGSLDDDGLLRKDLDTIADELAIYHGMDCSKEEITEVLHILQDFDPAGIGAQSLQECLLLQIERKDNSRLKELMRCVIADYFDEFKKKHWHKIKAGLALSDIQAEALEAEIRKLNPKPGASMGETLGRNTQQITPDFIVDTADNGTVTFTLNQGNIPELFVSRTFADMVDSYRSNKEGMNRQEKEALLYAKGKVDRARGFIEAIRQRRHSLYLTMKAIIEWQIKFFREGDESDLRPMILKDIADKTGLDISTVSRVSNIKYAQTKWGTFPLRFFFSDGYTTNDGETMSTRKIKIMLKEIIDKENKAKPMSDELLTRIMAERGFPIARRTVAKYREQMGIPVARLRR